jgi:peptidoglycan/LPS O-acetylase OafA/YrhL
MPTPRRSHRPPVAATPPAAPNETDVIPALTGLRGVAAFAVFAYHVWVYSHAALVAPGHPFASAVLAWPLKIGWVGVDIFFTLSAFLLSLPYARAALAQAPPPSLRTYLRRRVLRIFPAYWVQWAILAAGALLGWSFGPLVPGWRGATETLAQALLWIKAWPSIAPTLGTWWTLPVEFGFYLLLPWFARAFAPRRWAWLLVAAALAWAWRAYWLMQGRLDFVTAGWIDQLPGRIDQFALGMLAAYGWVRLRAAGRTLAPRVADGWLLGAALVFVALPALLLLDGRGVPSELPSLHPAVLPWHSSASVAVAAMLVACAAGAPSARALAAWPLQALGRISYSLYLWHLPAVSWVLAAGGQVEADGFWPFFAACLLLSLALATASWWAIERPALRLAHRATIPAR